ncbi:sarcosine oxidase subunit delta [Microbulbifer sp. S227A]|uniref:sarcosine oxidase subunit delta n=1 Tax=Microbulbifer sp. S227A TaxID=3415131 RepID=UPI003C7D3658
MIIPHPLLGPRDMAEFTYLGAASLMDRPSPEDGLHAMHEHVYLRDNPAGEHRELWYHAQGDRSWLVVTRNTLTQEITCVELARDIALEALA